MSRQARPRGSQRGAAIILMIAAVFFIAPLVAMLRFSFQNVPMIRLDASTLLSGWSVSGATKSFGDAEFRSSLWLSVKLALGTVMLSLLLLVPTSLWVHLRIPKLRPLVEFFTLLPYVIPSIALVAGVLPLKPYARWFLNSNYSLIPFYVILALPFSYRALDVGLAAIDVRTLVDASRSLGASLGTTLRRVILPNLRVAVLSAAFLTCAVVLGEYTMARVLLKQTFPSFLAQYQSREPQGGMGLALFAMLVTTLLFGALGVATRRLSSVRRRRSNESVETEGAVR
jgi:putative spermidine/putrescine transport system permease protein